MWIARAGCDQSTHRPQLERAATELRAELGDVDRTKAAALLLGPIALGKLSTLPDFDYREIAVAAVDGFLATHRKKPNRISAASNESAGV